MIVKIKPKKTKKNKKKGISSIGRAIVLHASGYKFKSYIPYVALLECLRIS